MTANATMARASAADVVRDAWDDPRLGLALRASLAWVLGIEVAIQLMFGQVDLPFVDVAWLEVGLGARPIPRGIFVEGAVLGSLYAFVAMGLVLVHRANRIINFAQAQLGAVPAVIALLLIARQGVNYWVVLPIVVFGGALLGGVTEVAVVRRFRDSSRLVLTVATIGLGFLLLVLEFYVKVWLPGETQLIAEFPTPFAGLDFNIGITRFFGDHIAAVVVAAIAALALGVFLRRSSLGIAVRASAENRDLASLLGIPVGRVGIVVWMLAGTLSALAVFLRAPLVGLSLEGFVGPIFLLFGLTAAVIARMEHLPTALVAGMFLGMVDNGVVFATKRNSLALAIMLAVILGALLLQRRQTDRAHDAATSTWQAVTTPRPIPLELRSLPEVRLARRLVAVAIGVVGITFPWIIGSSRVTFAILAVIFAMVGVSLVVLTGWAGQVSLGQFAITGIGAAVAGGLIANHDIDFFVALAAAGAAGALVAVAIGIPALRIRGLYLAVTTLAFAFAVENFVLRREYFPWLLPGDFKIVRSPILWGRVDTGADSEFAGVTITAQTKYYWMCLAFLLLTLAAANALRRHRSGRVLIGLRDNEPLMMAYAVNPTTSRLSVFAVSGFMAALAGGLLVPQLGTVAQGAFKPEDSIQLFVMTVIGGIGSLAGPILGALLLEGVPQLPGLRNIDLVRVLTTGIGVLAVLLLLPGGLAQGLYGLRDRLLRRVADRHAIVVPSLVADVATAPGVARGVGVEGPDGQT